MKPRDFLAAVLLSALCSGAALAAHAPDHPGASPSLDKASLRLLADRSAYLPGETAQIGALFTVERGWHVNSNQPTFDFLIPTTIEFELPADWRVESVEYPAGEMKSFAFTGGQSISVYDGESKILARIRVPDDAQPPSGGQVNASLRYQACSDSICLPPTVARASLTLPVDAGGKSINAATFGGAAPEKPAVSLALILLISLLGGLILNAMPCVLPVLSLKLLSLVGSAGQGNARVIKGALATSAGILISFWGLAAAAAGARAAGAAVGWGMQFQQPVFVASLTVIVVLFCLNLWGVFEIRLPGVIADTAATTGPKHGLGSHLAAGFFATLMATPCSAPFLGTAIGFALSRSTLEIFAIFTVLGIGMALPYLLVAAVPASLRLFPRPGAWMAHFKMIMGFLLAATAVWLLYVLGAQLSAERLAFVQVALLCIALFLWARSKSRAGLGRGIFTAGTVLAAVVTVGLSNPTRTETSALSPQTSARLIDWKVFNRGQAEQLARQGTPVFVYVTADWCFTCKVNEALVLETGEVASAFHSAGVMPMRADWTNRDDAITRFLRDHGRYGIPFYLLYMPGGETHLFDEIITKGEVISAVERSAGATVTVKRPRPPAALPSS